MDATHLDNTAYETRLRFLQGEEEEAVLSSSEIIRTTCKVYGSIFLVLFVIFLVARQRHPGVYNIKKTYPKLYVPLAENFFGPLVWCWKVFQIPYQDIADQCGMDAGEYLGGCVMNCHCGFNNSFVLTMSVAFPYFLFPKSQRRPFAFWSLVPS